MTRCAIYCRYSTDMQKESSLVDQEREAREYAERHGWTVVGVYADAAMSGGSSNRPDFERLKADADRGAFDVVLSESLDRLSRNLSVSSQLLDELNFAGVRLFTIQYGEMNKMLVGVIGAVSDQFSSDLRDKVKRGQKGRVLHGKVAGGVGYGYTVGEPGERKIDPEQALVVHRIFNMFADGVSPRAIAKILNDEGIEGPKGNVWKDTTIRGQRDRGTGLLNNEAYVGRLIYGRTQYTKNPKTGRRVSRPQPEENWTVTEVPELRIINDELWHRVKERQAVNTIVMPRDGDNRAMNRVHRKVHPLSGVLICGCCGGPLAITAKNRYGCSGYRASRTCENSRTIPRKEVEDRVFEGLRSGLLNSDYLDTFVAEFQREVDRLRKATTSELASNKKRLANVARQIDRIVDHIVNGTDTKSITSKLVDLEAEKESLEAEVSQSEDSTTVIPIHNIGQVYRAKIRQLTDGLSDPAIKLQAIEAIQGLIDHIKVTPTNTGFDVELHGELGAIMEMVDQNDRRPAVYTAGRSLSVVAGVGFEPTTFRL
ncbi:recombinase family protein [Ascidiaceihabitans donghaensis]|uniref:recombinase family protein n=1 Tax=Ascidiaceihabitans donghaensis TaxID=1510460 RepID=UPI003BEF0929